MALDNPSKQVVLLDLSIQGDASVFLLGGVAEPSACVKGVRTRGAEKIAALRPGVSRFVNHVLETPTTPTPTPTKSFWRGSSLAPQPPPKPTLRWQDFAVKPSEVHPEGGAPQNFWIIHGGKDVLLGLQPDVSLEELSTALRAAFDTMHDTIVIIDTDAELSERGASLAGIAAADSLALVLSSSWTDYLRTLDDPVNSLFDALKFLSTQSNIKLRAKIEHVVVNDVFKTKSAPCGVLSFTPSKVSDKAIADIVAHLFSMTADPSTGYAKFFGPKDCLASVEKFTRAQLVGVSTVPESVWQASWTNGEPVVVRPTSDAHETAAIQYETVAKRFV